MEDLKERKWTYTYIGTDHDVDKVALPISINNMMKFEKDNDSMHAMFLKESNARMAYSQMSECKKAPKMIFMKNHKMT